MPRRVAAALAAVAAAAAAAGGAVAARAHAAERCEASMASFPARVLAVDVEWQLLRPRYECVYALVHGGRLEWPPCPAGHYRPTGAPRCVPGTR